MKCTLSRSEGPWKGIDVSTTYLVLGARASFGAMARLSLMVAAAYLLECTHLFSAYNKTIFRDC